MSQLFRGPQHAALLAGLHANSSPAPSKGEKSSSDPRGASSAQTSSASTAGRKQLNSDNPSRAAPLNTASNVTDMFNRANIANTVASFAAGVASHAKRSDSQAPVIQVAKATTCRGMSNGSQRCFKNAALQCLAHLPGFVDDVMNESAKGKPVTQAFQELLSAIWTPQENGEAVEDERVRLVGAIIARARKLDNLFRWRNLFNTSTTIKDLNKHTRIVTRVKRIDKHANVEISVREFTKRKDPLVANVIAENVLRQQEAQEMIIAVRDALYEESTQKTSEWTYDETKTIEENRLLLQDALPKKDESVSTDQPDQKKLEAVSYVNKTFAFFGGTIQMCLRCGTISKKFSASKELQVSVREMQDQTSLKSFEPETRTLQECIQSYSHPEHMEGREKVLCLNCQNDPTCEDPYQEAAKKMYVATFPRILVIQLKRWNGEGMHAKLTDHIGIPIGPLTVQELFAETPEMRVDYSGQELYTQDELNTKYTLVGVIMHSGGENGGHYYAYCRHPYYDSGNDMYKSWYCLNDTSSTTRTEEEVTGALQAHADEPYFLFYHKCK